MIFFSENCKNKVEGFINWQSDTDDKECKDCTCATLLKTAKRPVTTKLCCDNHQNMQTECCPLCTGLMDRGRDKFCGGISFL